MKHCTLPGTLRLSQVWDYLYHLLSNTFLSHVGTAVLKQHCCTTAVMTTLWSKKLHPFYFLNNFVKICSILIIFSAQIPEWIFNKTVTKLSISPNECHYTTLWKTTCVNLFITTAMQALNVMTNWQLWTNTSQQMFNVFAFGFDMCIKTISPLINCLINDALLDSQAFLLNIFVYDASHCPPWNASFPGGLTGCVSLVHPPDSPPNHWLHQCSLQYVMCEVCHCPDVNLLLRQFLAV